MYLKNTLAVITPRTKPLTTNLYEIFLQLVASTTLLLKSLMAAKAPVVTRSLVKSFWVHMRAKMINAWNVEKLAMNRTYASMNTSLYVIFKVRSNHTSREKCMGRIYEEERFSGDWLTDWSMCVLFARCFCESWSQQHNALQNAPVFYTWLFHHFPNTFLFTFIFAYIFSLKQHPTLYMYYTTFSICLEHSKNEKLLVISPLIMQIKLIIWIIFQIFSCSPSCCTILTKSPQVSWNSQAHQSTLLWRCRSQPTMPNSTNHELHASLLSGPKLLTGLPPFFRVIPQSHSSQFHLNVADPFLC